MAPVQRRIPRWAELRPLVRVQTPSLHRTERALSRASTIADLRTLARRRIPRSVFDYVDGGAEAEISLHRARDAFARVEFRPRVLRNVLQVDASTTVLGTPSSLPLVLAPTGFTRMMHHEGERAVVRAAAAAGVPYTLSTMGTVSIEDLAAEAPQAHRWFQLYLWQDRGRSLELIRRADAAGYPTLVLTVDTAVAGRRLRDVRNGLTIPPALTARTLADMAVHPRWWANLLTTDPLEFASLRESGGTVADLVDRMFDPAVTVADLDWLRDNWSGRIVIKGVQHPDDAREFVAAGADGVVVSNHGGRQLDGCVPTAVALEEVVEAVGGAVPVLVDGGIRDGGDVLRALALGARAVLVGRPYAWGLASGGQDGAREALEALTGDLERAMALAGCPNLAAITRDRVRPALW